MLHPLLGTFPPKLVFCNYITGSAYFAFWRPIPRYSTISCQKLPSAVATYILVSSPKIFPCSATASERSDIFACFPRIASVNLSSPLSARFRVVCPCLKARRSPFCVSRICDAHIVAVQTLTSLLVSLWIFNDAARWLGTTFPVTRVVRGAQHVEEITARQFFS